MRISDWSSDVSLPISLPADLATPDFVVERPKDRGHGDFSTNAAMLLARPARSNPRALAQALVDALPPNDDIAAVEIAGRSEERRVGKECVCTVRSRWSRYH